MPLRHGHRGVVGVAAGGERVGLQHVAHVDPGIGMSLRWASSRTIAYSSGYSSSVTGLDLVVAMAILSENQYIEKLNTRAMTSAIHGPAGAPEPARRRARRARPGPR